MNTFDFYPIFSPSYMAALNFLSGVTEHNKESVIQGQLDIPLSHDGITQAKLLGVKLQDLVWKEVHTFELVDFSIFIMSL